MVANLVLPASFLRDIEVVTPYPARAMWLDKHTTYLDTVGRPAIMFEYKDLTIRHAQNIYVSSTLLSEMSFPDA